MADEEDSMSEGFSASEDEWTPTKNVRGGESSDDDDSDYEESPIGGAAEATNPTLKKRGEPKARSAAKQASKKRSGVSLRTKLYNKYKPPPKTFSPSSSTGKNSPSATTSRSSSKNAKAPNESSLRHKLNSDSGSSSDGSIDDYLVNPEDLDFQSSFFISENKSNARKSVSPAPVFDCNAGVGNLSDDSASEDIDDDDDNNEEKSGADQTTKLFDFHGLLENANSFERVKETIQKRVAEDAAAAAKVGAGTPSKKRPESKIDTMDVYSLLALGEKQNRSHNDGEDEDDEDDEEGENAIGDGKNHRKATSKLNKTKSTRVKRHTKTRPSSTIATGGGGESDDSDWEEVAETSSTLENTTATSTDLSQIGSLEIHVELPSRNREKKNRTQMELEMALKRKLNREIKERQILLHKASLLFCFGRSYFYNRLLNDTILMNKALKLLPSKNAYPPESGTEIKYYQSLVTWFKTAIKLTSNSLYPGKGSAKTKAKAHTELMKQIEDREARSKQDMIFMFIILLRGMGLQCRLIVNMQPLPLKPAQSDLLTIKMKNNEDDSEKCASVSTKNGSKPATSSSCKNQGGKAAHGIEASSTSENEHQLIKKNPQKSLSSSKKNTGNTDEYESRKNKSLESGNSLKKTNAFTGSISNSVFSDKKSSQSGSESKIDVAKSENIKHKIKQKSSELSKNSTSLNEKAKSKRTSCEQVIEMSEVNKDVYVAKKAPSLARLKQKKAENKPQTVITDQDVLKIENPIPKSNSAVPTKEENSILPKNEDGILDAVENSQKENTTTNTIKKPTLSRLKRTKAPEDKEPKSNPKKPTIAIGSLVLPKIVVQNGKEIYKRDTNDKPSISTATRSTRSRSKSPQMPHINAAFLQSKNYKEKFPEPAIDSSRTTRSRSRSKSPQVPHINAAFLQSKNYKERFTGIVEQKNSNSKPKPTTIKRVKSPLVDKAKINTDSLTQPTANQSKRVLRSRLKPNETVTTLSKSNETSISNTLTIPQIDGADDIEMKSKIKKRIKPKNTKASSNYSDDDFEPSPSKKPKQAPVLNKKVQELRKDRRVLSTDDDDNDSTENSKRKQTANDMWAEVWCELEQQWICVDIFHGKVASIDNIRKYATSNLAYVFAFQNDLSLKDVTARYCPHWTTVVRKSRVEKAWLDTAIAMYLGHRTKRDINEDQELRLIHEAKPMPTAISDYKNHPFYALERHLLKFEAIYPPNAPTLGYVRKEAVYSRDCVHSLHSREIWLKQARVVKLGEQPYKIVKARPKWDRITQTVIKDQPLEVFGYWQTQDYEPPTAENGIVPRNAYGNVELFKPSMLPKKTAHLRYTGLNRICKKLNIDCANAVIGFDFHQGSCHPLYDGFIVCEEFADQVVAAWHQDQIDQERKQQDKYEARVYGNWKKLIRGLLIRERLKLKYNF